MYSSILAKWSGPAAMLAGVLSGVWGSLPHDPTLRGLAIAQNALATIVPLLFLLGLAGLRARCVGRAGRLGRAGLEAGFVLGFVALAWGGVVLLFVDIAPLYKFLARGGWPPWLSNWFAWLVVSLIVVGAVNTRKAALQRLISSPSSRKSATRLPRSATATRGLSAPRRSSYSINRTGVLTL